MKTITKILKQLTLAAAVSAIAGVAVAATNPGAPTPGSSQGDFDVTLNKQDLIIINNFQDMVLAQFIAAGGDFVGSQNLCVGRAGASGGSAASYAITASNAKSSFALNNGGATPQDNIPYQVFFNNAVQGVQEFGGKTELQHSVQQVGFDTELPETGCTGGATNSTIWVKAAGADIAAANTGVFTDTVTVTVAVN